MLTKLSIRVSILLVACALAFATAATAQTVVPRLEIGGDATIGAVNESGFRVPGGGVRLDVNVTPALALETRATRFVLPFELGAAAQVMSGVRATLVRGRHLSLFGVALPGMARVKIERFATILMDDSVSASNGGAVVLTSVAPAPVRQTQFVLEMGLGLVVVPTTNLRARIELNRDLHAMKGFVETLYSSSGPSLTFRSPAPITGAWTLQVGGSYGLGRHLERVATLGVPRRWTIGGQAGLTISTSAQVNSAAGVFATYRLARWCDLDASASGFLSPTLTSSPYEGGRVTQYVGGAKLGVRENRVGVFLKLRAGVNHDTKVINVNDGPVFQSLTIGVLDLGGVIETYLSPRTGMRIDLGETLAFAPDPFGPGPIEHYYGLPIRFGIGWRF